MSKESIQWFQDNAMFGFASHREKWEGNGYVILGDDGSYKAWWAQEDFEWSYPDAIPVEDVEAHLFGWEAMACQSMFAVPCGVEDMTMLDPQGRPVRVVWDPTHQHIVRSDTEQVFSVPTDTYPIHQFKLWLLDNVANLLDSELGIASAFLLQGGAIAVVNLELPDDIEVQGLAFRPGLLAYTSHNLRLPTAYKTVKNLSVCDNSFEAQLREKDGAQYILRHTRNSVHKVMDARSALGLLYKTTEDFAKEIEWLADWEVSMKEWDTLLNVMVPVPETKVDEKGNQTSGNKRAITNATTKRAQLANLYLHDERVEPWNGTALGVVQAFNTWDQHERSARAEGGKFERSWMEVLSGQRAESDTQVVKVLAEVCERTVMV